MTRHPATPPSADDAIHQLLESCGGDPASFDGRLVAQMIGTCIKLMREGHDTGQLKLINSALKELRYGYRVFNRYVGVPKITIYGSARTPEDHPDYVAARDFSRTMADRGWMAITGAGDGIMKAGHEGPQREASFGLSIRLPFETTANTVIEGDPKLINFRYFFTRKLMFMSHADAVAVFPGGFGTQDELFEALTLVQTGKSVLVPIVLVQGGTGGYWESWEAHIRESLLGNGWISPEDPGLYFIAPDPLAAVDHVCRFYRVYHSSRYVDDVLVIRLNRPLAPDHLARLNEQFGSLVHTGSIHATGPLAGETDHLDLPRIAFAHTRRQYGLLRRLVDAVNDGVESA